MLAHSRADETEADELGARYTAAAGYDPHAFITFFQRLQKSEGASPKLLSYLSDHPATGDRIDHLGPSLPASTWPARTSARPSTGSTKTHLLTLPTAAPVKTQSGAPAGAPPPAARPPAAPPPR